jgi:Caspase domain.
LENNYDFEKIIKVNDANRSDIFNAFRKLNKLTTDEDYILIYYSGHGMRTEKQAYWIPVEAEREWGDGSWINTSDIHVAISKVKAKHILLLSDSCYVGNAFKGNNDEIENTQNKNVDKKFIENILMERARWFISSGGNSQVMDEVVEGHSLFAYKLIDLLKKNKSYLTSDVLFSEISKYNSQFLFSGGYNQSPVIGTVDTWGHLGGHFVFLPK